MAKNDPKWAKNDQKVTFSGGGPKNTPEGVKISPNRARNQSRQNHIGLTKKLTKSEKKTKKKQKNVKKMTKNDQK